MRVMLLTSDRKTAQLYSDAAEETSALRLCVMKHIGQVLERLFRDPFDALLSDDVSVLQTQIRKCRVRWPAHTFLLIDRPIGTRQLPQTLTYCFLKDGDPKEILRQIACFPNGASRRRDPEAEISCFLQQTGVPVSLYGFAYLRIALRVLLSVKELLDVSAIDDLYALISAMTGVDANAAEHAIRHAIDTAWMRADTDLLDKLFGYTVRSDRGAPSNAAFLFGTADHIRVIREGNRYDAEGIA
jgi:hypothetical protein